METDHQQGPSESAVPIDPNVGTSMDSTQIQEQDHKHLPSINPDTPGPIATPPVRSRSTTGTNTPTSVRSTMAQIGTMSVAVPFSSHFRDLALPPTSSLPTSPGPSHMTPNSETLVHREHQSLAGLQSLGAGPESERALQAQPNRPSTGARHTGPEAAALNELFAQAMATSALPSDSFSTSAHEAPANAQLALQELAHRLSALESRNIPADQSAPTPPSHIALPPVTASLASSTSSSILSSTFTLPAASSSATIPRTLAQRTPFKRARTNDSVDPRSLPKVVISALNQHGANLQVPKAEIIHGLPHPKRSEAPTDRMDRLQQTHRERLAQLATKPMAKRDLQTLLQAELETEDRTLQEMGVMLHKELLKLQLEEGVFLSMLELTEGGTMSMKDMKRVYPTRKRKETNMTPKSSNKDKVAPGTREFFGTIVEPIRVDDTSDLQFEDWVQVMDRMYSQENRASDVLEEVEPMGDRALQTQGNQRDIEVEEDEEVEEEENEDDIALLSRLAYQAPSESYSSRPFQAIASAVGTDRPSESVPRGAHPLDEIKKIVIERGRKRTVQEMDELGEENAAVQENEGDYDEEMLELEYDNDDMETLLELERHYIETSAGSGETAGESSRQSRKTGPEGENKDESGSEEEGDDDSDDSDDEEDYLESDEEEAGFDEEDEEAQRKALSRMLAEYGAL
ncbi:hypothetical protein BGW38_003250 [Lunasporangiospora selenospora]|uniref:Uncharacterized protein n=1 Tax=Lunasporangiospora selenospora TaxID=979761 RepID=A0A9P6FS35_9FUNG|nr:hypothetical protein BGW38_003250 [Lunasporangiospora selenospora]